jgi:hypothetical protein
VRNSEGTEAARFGEGAKRREKRRRALDQSRGAMVAFVVQRRRVKEEERERKPEVKMVVFLTETCGARF